MATRSSILAQKIPWTEEPGGLQSVGSQTVEHNLVTGHQQQRTVLGNGMPEPSPGASQAALLWMSPDPCIFNNLPGECSLQPRLRIRSQKKGNAGSRNTHL